MKNHKVLITGGCGFIGANLVRFILNKTDWEVVVLDNLSSGKRENINGLDKSRIALIKGDIRNKQDVDKAMENCDYVVNLAAQAGVIPSMKDPFFDMDVNIRGIITLLDASVKNDVKKFVQASSAAPLGEQEMPLDESKVPAPLSPYGASKLAGEGYCIAYSGSFGLATIVLRFSNVYGPWSGSKESVIALFIRQILVGEKLTIYGDGKQTRDFVHVKDVCQGVYLSLIKELPNTYNLFQLGTGKETSINKLFNLLKKSFSKEIRFQYAPERKGEIYRNYTNIEKARKLLGYKPDTELNKGLEETIDWFIQHE